MNVWVIQVGEPLPIAPGRPRVWRSGLLADRLAARGHEVLWWASTFEHWSKSHLYETSRDVRVSDRLTIRLLHSPGYRRNVSLQRLLDHKLLARRFRREAEARRPRPDVIHCAFPTIELSVEATRYGARHGVPVIVDARDMWPEIFVEALPAVIRPAARVALAREFAQAREAFRGATAVTGHAPGFVEFGLAKAGRAAGPLDRDFPFAYPNTAPSATDAAAARAFWTAQGLDMTSAAPVICFLGAFGTQRALDLHTPIAAARVLRARGQQVQLVLCGDGPRLGACREAAREVPGLLLPGWVDAAQIWTLLRRSAAGLLPYLPAADFVMSLPNKVVEYLSASLPVITSLTGGYAERLLRSADCGVFYRGGDADDLAATVTALLADTPRLGAMRQNAALLFDRTFTEDRVCSAMVEHVERVARSHGAAGAVA